MKKNFKEIIKEICIEDNINCKFLSKDWVIMLEKDGKTRFISGYKFDSNSHGLGLIADDKYALYEVLKSKNIPIIEHKIVYNKTNNLDYAIGCNTYEYVKEYFHKNNENIVIKPNEGTCGKNVFNITDVNEIDIILDKIFLKNFSISICPFYKIKHEYRAIMLDGENALLYAKYLPVVTGDGNKSIRQLLLNFNYDYFVNKSFVLKNHYNLSTVCSFTFFIYLFHEPTLNVVRKLLILVLGRSSLGFAVNYMLSPWIFAILFILLGLFCRKYIPRLYSICVGDR
jgi:hypothetical protein